MKVFIVGSHGQTGRQLITLLTESGEYGVRAMVRNQAHMESFHKLGTETALLIWRAT
jgi:N-acetyl-gamma-glutamylphosphate reductase